MAHTNCSMINTVTINQRYTGLPIELPCMAAHWQQGMAHSHAPDGQQYHGKMQGDRLTDIHSFL